MGESAAVTLTKVRALLVLGRVSNLPTIWSNCLAGWILGGGRNIPQFCWLVAGATFSYVGGMFLNDAFDAEFDQRYRPERPIPSGSISISSVWRWGLACLGLGGLCFIAVGLVTGALGIFLLVTILCYDAFHKQIEWAPLIMGLCRVLVYVAASSTGIYGITGTSIWCALALGLYIVGLSFIARGEAIKTPIRYWPLLPIAAPVFLALILNADGFREPAILLSGVLGLWVVKAIRHTFWSSPPRIGVSISHLLAGIVIVDFLAILGMPRALTPAFLALFLAALLFQRIIPAT